MRVLCRGLAVCQTVLRLAAGYDSGYVFTLGEAVRIPRARLRNPNPRTRTITLDECVGQSDQSIYLL